MEKLWKKREVDLHLHSNFSDGSKSPKEVARQLFIADVRMAALTDHDTLLGVDQFMLHCTKYGIMVIPGVEVTTVYKKKYDVHILGYNVVHQMDGAEKLFERNNNERVIRTKKAINKLNEEGLLSATFEELTKHYQYPGYCITLLHAMDFMVFDDGLEFQAARKAVLGTEYFGACRDVSMILSSVEGVQVVKQLGGVPVLAHPGEFEKQIDGTAFEKREMLFNLLCELKAEGLRGLEAFHSKHTPEEEREYAAFAKNLKLIITAGSDYHGRHKIDQEVGRHGVSTFDVINHFSIR